MSLDAERERFRRASERFDELVELDEAARAARLAELSAADPALGAELAGLLDADRASQDFLAAPADELLTTFAAELAGETEGGLAPGERLGAWRVLRPLGRGGMGEVWAVERADGEFELEAALKLLKRGLDSEQMLRRFRAERQILARLRHPSIARFYDGGVARDGRPYYVLELVVGRPITAASAGQEVEARLARFLAACDAVDAAHRALVVHRDLKPSNILVTESGDVKLLDFGIAKVLSDDGDGADERTRVDQRALTPAYAAPEQILGEPVTTATDVYALGVVLYELLTGERPHRRSATSAARLAEEVTRETVERPSAAARRSAAGNAPAEERERSTRRARQLRGDLDAIVLRALAREPERRYPSAAALAADLRRHLAGQPVEARPDSTAYRVRKFARRHRTGVAAAALALVALVAGLAVALVQAENARREAQRALRVRDLMSSIFEQSTPEVSGDPDVRASELLGQGARRIEEELATTEPEVASELLSTISVAFYQLGRFDDAERLGRRAAELLDRAPDSEATAVARERALRAYGEALIEQRRLDEAVAVLERAVRSTRAALGAEALATAHAERSYAQALNHAGRHAEALVLDRHVLEVYRRLLPAEHRELALHHISLGTTYDWLDRSEESIAAYRDGIAMLERLLGPGHTQLADPLNNLAVVLVMADRSEEALPVIERAVAIRRASVPWGHSWLAFTLSQYSGILSELDRLDESTVVAREMLEMLRANDPDDPNVPRALNRLAVDELRRGRPELAAGLFEEVFANAERIGTARDDPRWLAWRSNASLAAIELGRLAEAQALLEESLAGRRALGGEERSDFANALAPWGTLRRLQGDFDAALEAHRRSIELIEVNRGAGHSQADAARLELAQDLLARGAPGDLDAALEAAEPVRAKWAAAGPPDRLRVLDAELVVARCRLSRNERDAARAALESLLPRQRTRRGADSPPTLETEIYLAAARGADPAPLVARYAALRGPTHWAVERVRAELAALR
jgi:serine/threonine-protein kinase